MHSNTLKFYKYSPVKKPKYKGKFCYRPFQTMQIDEDGDVMLCGCQLHMPYVIGNIYQNSLQEIWVNHEATQVRQSVVDGDFTYCNWPCAHLPNLAEAPATFPKISNFPKVININLDRSCNLKCPSCREDIIIEKNSDKIVKQNKIFEEIVEYGLAHPTEEITIVPINSGDPFASHSGLQFLKSLKDYPYNNIKLYITTNGTLINRNKELMLSLKKFLAGFKISIDAATPETYALVRVGNWNELLKGLNIVQELKVSTSFEFVVQKNNCHEIESFADFSHSYGAGQVSYLKLLDWGHWNTQWWHDNNVFDRTRPSFRSALDSINRVKIKYPKFTNITTDILKYLEKPESPQDR